MNTARIFGGRLDEVTILELHSERPQRNVPPTQYATIIYGGTDTLFFLSDSTVAKHGDGILLNLHDPQILGLQNGRDIETAMRANRLWVDFKREGDVQEDSWLQNVLTLTEDDPCSKVGVGLCTLLKVRDPKGILFRLLVFPNIDWDIEPRIIQIDCRDLARGPQFIRIDPAQHAIYEKLL